MTCGEIEYDFAREKQLSRIIDLKTVPILKQTKKGLCISFICFDVAIRRMTGETAVPDIKRTDDSGVFHVVTKVDRGGKIEVIDPTYEIINLGSYKSAPAICDC